MNNIIKCGRNFMAISNSIEADCHKHWLFQMFLRQNELNIEVNGQLILCIAILINMDTQHTFDAQGEPHFTMLIDPTTELGRVMKGLLENQPFYIFPHEKNIDMQQNFRNALEQNERDDILSFAQSVINQFYSSNMKGFDNRVVRVLNLLDDCMHEDESHQIKYFSEETGLSESRLAHLFK